MNENIMDIILASLFIANIVFAILDHNTSGILGWTCAVIMLGRVYMYRERK